MPAVLTPDDNRQDLDAVRLVEIHGVPPLKSVLAVPPIPPPSMLLSESVANDPTAIRAAAPARNSGYVGRQDRATLKIRACRDWSVAKIAGRMMRVAQVAPRRPPITARPSGALCSPPSPSPSASAPSGQHRESWSSGSDADGSARLRSRLPWFAALDPALRSAKSRGGWAFATANADRMIAHEGLNVGVSG